MTDLYTNICSDTTDNMLPKRNDKYKCSIWTSWLVQLAGTKRLVIGTTIGAALLGLFLINALPSVSQQAGVAVSGIVTIEAVANSNANLDAVPKACLVARTGSKHHPNYHQNVPGSFELFAENGVVCPNQTLEDLQSGNLASVSPDEWERHRRDQGGSWDGEGRGQGLIVLKRGGSGSTWFDKLMKTHPDFDFRHEAHHSLYKKTDSMEIVTRRMRDFLKGKGKCISDGGYCGFSISPSKHAAGVDWSELIRDTGATLVVFVRTNVIKRILGLKKKLLINRLPSQCTVGSSYNASMKDDPDCVIGNSTQIDMTYIREEIDNHCFAQSWELLETAIDSGAPFQILTYEGMQQNLTTTFKRLGAFSGWPLGSFDWSSHVTTGKVSPEDLQTSISNYAEIEEELKKKPCFLDMLHSNAQQMSPLCYPRRNDNN